MNITRAVIIALNVSPVGRTDQPAGLSVHHLNTATGTGRVPSGVGGLHLGETVDGSRPRRAVVVAVAGINLPHVNARAILDFSLRVISIVPSQEQPDASVRIVLHHGRIAAGVRAVAPDHLLRSPRQTAVETAAQDRVNVASVARRLLPAFAEGEQRSVHRFI